MAAKPLRIMLVGDLVLDEPEADRFFDLARATLKQCDVLIGHVETPHTTRGEEAKGDIPAPGADPENLKALKNAGFHMASLAGNHIHDRGAEGVADTRDGLAALGIAAAGAGKDIAEARKAAFVEAGGRRVALLSYNCVGPKMGWAGKAQAGCAYVRVVSHYEMEVANPGGPPETFTFPTPDTIEAMQADIAEAKRGADVVVVSLHKGLVHRPAKLAMYERLITKAAVEGGADIVFGHHAHILKGLEVYRGKPVFHGLGNFVTVTKALSVEDNPSPERRAWAVKRKEMFGFEPDPAYPLYPFHPEAKNALIAVCDVAVDGSVSAGFIPCWMEAPGCPRPLNRSEGEKVKAYVEAITAKAGLKASFAWDGDVVRIA